ncbi:MAG: peroxiredoxin family protein [Anaerolineales bacterium]
MQFAKQKILIGCSMLILILSAAWIWISIPTPGSTTQGQIQAPQVGFAAPDFTLETYEGQTYALSEFRGKPVLVNFWASWCPPCRSEMPAMQRVYEDFEEEGFIVLAINSTNQDNIGEALSFGQDRQLSFPILLDRTGSVSSLYEIRSLPASYFIDPEGIIQDVVIGGPMSEALLRIRVEEMLEGKS